MAEIKAVFFDMDGVLVDARDWHYEALNAALAPFGMAINRDEHLSTFDGLSTRQKLEILSRSRGLPRGLHSFLNLLKQRHTQALVAGRCHPVFHHRYMLSRLKQDGYHLAMCSNSVRETVDSIGRHAAIAEFFDFTLSNQDVDNPKPAPDLYLKAMQLLDLAPDACLVVEDNAKGIAAAHAAGAHVLEVIDPDDVTYDRVMAALASINKGAEP